MTTHTFREQRVVYQGFARNEEIILVVCDCGWSSEVGAQDAKDVEAVKLSHKLDLLAENAGLSFVMSQDPTARPLLRIKQF